MSLFYYVLLIAIYLSIYIYMVGDKYRYSLSFFRPRYDAILKIYNVAINEINNIELHLFYFNVQIVLIAGN